MNWKQIFKTVIVLGAVVAIISLAAPHNGTPNTAVAPETGLRTIQLAGQDIKASVVSTREERSKGLGGRIGLARNEGMLFVFDSDGEYRFWMKDMLFPIDILWLSEGGGVVDIKGKISPATYPDVFTPKAPARYVLELPAGFSEEYSVKVGDIVGL
ncbi:MAG: DUF192 domain-containing protein [Patescibacteria group bacterium]